MRITLTKRMIHEVMREIGRRGGKSRSPEKRAAAVANGRLGGRPRKRGAR